MSIATTIFHIQARTPEQIEAALDGVFAREERPRTLRVEGSYSAVLARVEDDALDASYRYLLLRPHGAGAWTPLLELGSRTDGLDVELSRALDGATIFTVYQYGEVVSGYRVTRGGVEVDRYSSDPTAFDGAEMGVAQDDTDESATPAPRIMAINVEALRGHPERFADLLPQGTAPEEFTRVVLTPGWWETHDAGGDADADVSEPTAVDAEEGDEDLVDELDRMRCIALALELWSADDYPLTQDLEDLPNKVIGPAIALAWS
ncbi:MAG TPA: hypothetical protein VE338_04075 [Ktedonobacterales bacterium]|nr:hypothetical protein [Ktedonobacterales bacterium]